MAKRHILKINGVEYTKYTKLRFTKERNKLGYIEFIMYSLKTSDFISNITYDKKITVEELQRSEYVEIFKGYIRNIKEATYRTTKITGYSPAIKLFDRSWGERPLYTNIATKDILSSIANNIMNIGTNDITTPITTRFELDNKLRSIANIANNNNAEWWTDEDSLGNNQINLSKNRYTTISVETIEVGQSVSITEDNSDNEKIYNCIKVVGRGDGINQVEANTYGFCYYQPNIIEDISSTSTSVTISDSSGFVSLNGIIYINNEKILYGNRTGNNLYNLTRGYNGTNAVQHTSGIRVWYAGTTGIEYTKDNPAPLSSVEKYGIREFTYPDKTIIMDIASPLEPTNPIDPNESCGIIATILYDRFENPVRTIKIKKVKNYMGYIDVGKTITIIDSTIGLNEDFKVYSVEMIHDRMGKDNGFNITLNNLQYNFSTELDEFKKNIDTSGMYEQGATNIFTVDQAENCDVSYPLKLRFYLPTDTKAINKVLLNFKVSDYRVYTTSGTTTTNSVGVIQDNSSYEASGIECNFDGSNYFDTISIDTNSSDCEGIFLMFSLFFWSTSLKEEDNIFLSWRIEDEDGNRYPSGDGGFIGHGDNWNDRDFPMQSVSAYIPGNMKNKIFTLQIFSKISSTWEFVASSSYMTFSRHTHEVIYGIGEPDPISDPLSVAVTVDGFKVGTYTNTENNEIDITSLVSDVGAGNWVDIEFTPNQNVRIEASASVQIYLESRL